jgi:hypothetical protein
MVNTQFISIIASNSYAIGRLIDSYQIEISSITVKYCESKGSGMFELMSNKNITFSNSSFIDN